MRREVLVAVVVLGLLSLALAAAAFVVTGSRADAGELPPGPVPAREGYRETTLPNGLRVVLLERRAVPLVSATAVVGAGSALESADFAGASHFLEHLLFNGTGAMTQEELYDAVDRIGGYNNASTADDYTVFTMLVPAEAAREGFAIQAAMLYDSTLPEEKFEKERKIVLEELARARARPGHDEEGALRRALWTGTPYRREVLGTEESLAGITLDRVREYYRAHYVPGNTLLFVTGDLGLDAMEQLVRETYGAFAGRDIATLFPSPLAADTAGTLRGVPRDGEPRAALLLPAPGPCSPGGAEAEILAAVLGGDAGPLRAAIATERAPSLGAAYMPGPGGSVLRVDARVAGGEDPAGVVAELLAALEAVGRDGLEPESIARTARALGAERVLMGQRLHYVGMLQADGLAACRDTPSAVLVPAAPDVDAVQDVARTVLRGAWSRARAVAMGPGVADGAATLTAPTVASAAPAAPASPVPGADVDRTLPNGLRVLAARESGAEVAAFHVLVRDRSAREPAGREGLADLLHRMLTRGTLLSGAGDLETRLERLGADIKVADDERIPWDDTYTSPGHSFIRLEVPAEAWVAALDLLAEMVRLPALEGAELTSMLERRLRKVAELDRAPADAADLAYRRALLGASHPLARAVPGRPGSLEGVTREELAAFAAAYLAPTGLVISAVTPEPAEDVAAAVAERFGSAPAGTPPPSAVPLPLTREPGPETVLTLDGSQGRIEAGLIAPLAEGQGPALRLLAALLSDRLGRVLREEQGLAYSLGAGASVHADRGWMSIVMGTRPENLETARAGIAAEMERLRETMAGNDEITRVAAALRARALMRRLPAVNRARALGLRAVTGQPLAEDDDAVVALAAVTREQLEALAATWLDPGRYRVVIVR